LVFTTVPAAFANEPDASLADRVRALCDVVLTHHVEAPTRQQMIHAGTVAMYRAVDKPPPGGLGERISGLTTYEQFATLLAEVRPKPGGRATTEAALDEAFIGGLSAAVPGGLRIMDAKESKVAEQFAGNRYVGIQIAVDTDNVSKLPKIAEAFEGGPAERAGMKKGDVIEAVDGKALSGGTLTEYIEKIRGDEGTTVTLVVRRAGEKEPRTFGMTREAMRRPTVFGPEGPKGVASTGTAPAPGAARPGSFRLVGSDPIGYLKVQSIVASTAREVREAAAKMEAEGLRAVVIDFRGLDSDELHPAVLLADELLDSGTIGRVRLAAREVTYHAEPGSLFHGWPMAVLVNEMTAAHAEWIAAALKANKRATIVGRATVGSGISRSTVPLGKAGRTVNLVTGLLVSADGRPIGSFEPAHRRTKGSELGVTPNVVTSSVREDAARLEARLKALQAELQRTRTGERAAELEAVRERLGKRADEDTALKEAMEVLAKALRPPQSVDGAGKMKAPASEGSGS
jgi:carboxyl-terminal processing protease